MPTPVVPITNLDNVNKTYTQGDTNYGLNAAGTAFEAKPTAPKTPSPVSSSGLATDLINTKITPTITNNTQSLIQQQQIADQKKKDDATILAAKQYAAKQNVPTPLTPEQQLVNQGMVDVYNTQTGETKKIDETTPLEAGWTKNNLSPTGASVATTEGGTVNFKQFADGTYGRFDKSTGNYTGVATAQDFKNAQDYTSNTQKMQDLINGNLPPEQQAQIDNMKKILDASVKELETSNKNYEGGVESMATMAGRGVAGMGLGLIQKAVSAGVTRIADLQAKNQQIISSMATAFKNDDLNALKQSYDQYNTVQSELTKQVNKAHDEVVQLAKDEANRKATAQNEFNSKADTLALDIKKAGGLTPAQQQAFDKERLAGNYDGMIAAAGNSLTTMSGDLSDYPQYARDMQAQGLIPHPATTWLAEKKATEAKQKANESYNNAYASEKGRQAGAGELYKNGTTAKEQRAMEEEARTKISRADNAARSGIMATAGMNISKANNVSQLINSSYDPKTGNYNLSGMNYGEALLALTSMLSGSNSPTNAQLSEIATRTGIGDINKLHSYLTGAVTNASSQPMIKQVISAIAREQAQSVKTRDEQRSLLISDAIPFDLEESRIDKIMGGKPLQPAQIKGASKMSVDEYIKSNPSKAATISAMYKVPGTTDEDVDEYIKLNNK